MKYRIALAAAALLLLGAAEETDRATAAEIAAFAKESPRHRSYPSPLILDWDRNLRKALATNSPDRAAALLAPQYGLPEATMRELVRLWLYISVHQYEFERRPGDAVRLRRQIHALVGASKRSPLLIEAAAESLDALEECRKDDFDALMAGSADPAADAMLIADAATCTDNYLRAIAVAPARAIPALVRLNGWGPLKPRGNLPLMAWLTSDAALARIAEPDRPRLAALLFRRRAALLFASGLIDEGVALVDSLAPEMRARVLAAEPGGFSATADGIALHFVQGRPDGSIKTDLATAYALAGRTAEAEALFATTPEVPETRRAFDCAIDRAAQPADRCKELPWLDNEVALLDRFLHHSDEDPYLTAEALFGGGSMGTLPAPSVELVCRWLADAQYADICNLGRTILIGEATSDPEDYDFAEAERTGKAIAALALPGYAEARSATDKALDAYAARHPDSAGASARWAPRGSIDPAPSPFAAQPLPARFAGKHGEPPAWPRGVAKLPEGYFPVRVEIAGTRAVAVSVSQNYDPTGEISAGGYWVHLSEDAGKSWKPPLYTGLAANFPYVVPSTSRMPMLRGDTLDLEVEVAELDTASITYPPVGLRTQRRQTGLYLQIPLAELTRDTNGDGFTDIAARHLLLDKARTDGGTPFVVGTTPAAECAGPPTPERLAIAGLLAKLFTGPSGALIEPVDRPAGEPLMIGNWGAAAESRDRPILIQGDPRDYACLRPDRLIIVYGEKDIAQLQTFTPDFRTIEVPRIIFNRARDRGYVKWSAGWTGGTYRLRWVGGKWLFDSISEWIT